MLEPESRHSNEWNIDADADAERSRTVTYASSLTTSLILRCRVSSPSVRCTATLLYVRLLPPNDSCTLARRIYKCYRLDCVRISPESKSTFVASSSSAVLPQAQRILGTAKWGSTSPGPFHSELPRWGVQILIFEEFSREQRTTNEFQCRQPHADVHYAARTSKTTYTYWKCDTCVLDGRRSQQLRASTNLCHRCADEEKSIDYNFINTNIQK